MRPALSALSLPPLTRSRSGTGTDVLPWTRIPGLRGGVGTLGGKWRGTREREVGSPEGGDEGSCLAHHPKLTSNPFASSLSSSPQDPSPAWVVVRPGRHPRRRPHSRGETVPRGGRLESTDLAHPFSVPTSTAFPRSLLSPRVTTDVASPRSDMAQVSGRAGGGVGWGRCVAAYESIQPSRRRPRRRRQARHTRARPRSLPGERRGRRKVLGRREAMEREEGVDSRGRSTHARQHPRGARGGVWEKEEVGGGRGDGRIRGRAGRRVPVIPLRSLPKHKLRTAISLPFLLFPWFPLVFRQMEFGNNNI